MSRILITGAGSGLGRGAALGLAHAGHEVVAGAEVWPQVRDLRAEAWRQRARLDVVKLDVTDPADRAHAPGATSTSSCSTPACRRRARWSRSRWHGSAARSR